MPLGAFASSGFFFSQSLRYQVTPSDEEERGDSYRVLGSQSLRYQVTPSDLFLGLRIDVSQNDSQSLRYQVTPSDVFGTSHRCFPE